MNSNTSKNSTGRGPKTGAKPAEARVITKEKHVPARVVVGNIPNIDFRPPEKHLNGAITVVISNGVTTRSWILHHPIGRTDLVGADWVLSQAEAVPELLSRKTDDDAQRVAQLKAVERLRLASQAGILEWKPDLDGYVYSGTTELRDHVVAAARERAQRKTKEDFDNQKKIHPKGDGPALKPRAYPDCIKSAAIRKLERRFIDFCQSDEVKAAVDAKHPDTFRTRSGPRKDQDQVSACVEGRHPNSQQLFDGLVYQIGQMKALGFADAKSMTEAGKLSEMVIRQPAPSNPGQPDDVTSSSEEEESDDEETMPGAGETAPGQGAPDLQPKVGTAAPMGRPGG